MSTYTSRQYRSGGTASGVHHSKEFALSDREYELLLEATYEMPSYQSIEARFIILVAGRLGMRSGEICHIKKSWLDQRRRMIIIPASQPCKSGKDGGICGSCEQAAKQMVEHNEGLGIEEARSMMWSPKTAAAAREIPFDADARAELVVERYLEKYGEFQCSQTGINRRVKKAAELAEGLDPSDVTPHGLRATAATRFASRGLDVTALQSMFGWAQLSTAHNYIRRSGENTARAIRDIQF